MLAAIVLFSALACGCNGQSASAGTGTTTAAAPLVSTVDAQNGAVIVSLAATTPGSKIYYTMDGSTPTAASQIYQAPLLIS